MFHRFHPKCKYKSIQRAAPIQKIIAGAFSGPFGGFRAQLLAGMYVYERSRLHRYSRHVCYIIAFKCRAQGAPLPQPIGVGLPRPSGFAARHGRAGAGAAALVCVQVSHEGLGQRVFCLFKGEPVVGCCNNLFAHILNRGWPDPAVCPLSGWFEHHLLGATVGVTSKLMGRFQSLGRAHHTQRGMCQGSDGRFLGCHDKLGPGIRLG